MRGKACSSCPLSRPNRHAATSKAASVGSPRTAVALASPGAAWTTASLQSAPPVSKRANPESRNSGNLRLSSPVSFAEDSSFLSASWSVATAMRFSVSVPVLSEQITVTEPSVSTADRLRMRALRRSMRCAPVAPHPKANFTSK